MHIKDEVIVQKGRDPNNIKYNRVDEINYKSSRGSKKNENNKINFV